MKKIMSLMLGLSLVLGAATVAFGQDTNTKKSTKGKKKGGTSPRPRAAAKSCPQFKIPAAFRRSSGSMP